MQGSRRMSFKEFENALELLAGAKGVDREEVRQKVAASPGPACNATQASAVRLHDDKSTYTGEPPTAISFCRVVRAISTLEALAALAIKITRG